MTWEETVTHPGASSSIFRPPTMRTSPARREVAHERARAREPHTANPRPWSLGVTLPTTPCPSVRCGCGSLMLNDDLADSACPPATIPAGATYYSCANIVLGAGRHGRPGGAGGGGGGAAEPAGRGGNAAGGRGGNAAGGRGGPAGAARVRQAPPARPASAVRPGSFGPGRTPDLGSGRNLRPGRVDMGSRKLGPGRLGPSGQAGTSGQAGAGSSGQAGNGSSGQAGSSDRRVRAVGDGDGSGGCQIGGGAHRRRWPAAGGRPDQTRRRRSRS